MGEVPDQRPIWDHKHANGDHADLVNVPSPLAQLSAGSMSAGSFILELGCGVGRDATLFAKQGNTIIATDGSEFVIEQNLAKPKMPNLSYELLDMREALPYPANHFDVVYSNLALHYFSDEKTKGIVSGIARVLKQDGLFIFACKSYDSIHNSGEEIENGLFVSPTGATLHFFTQEYIHELLDDIMVIEHLSEVEEDYNGKHSKIVRCIARKA